jgi:hypothetical protein
MLDEALGDDPVFGTTAGESARFRCELSDANRTPPGQRRQGAPASIDLLTALRGPGDSYSDVIIRLAKDDGRGEWIARRAEAKLGALGLRASASNPPALRPAMMKRDKPRAQGARRGARRALLCGPEWESRARL